MAYNTPGYSSSLLPGFTSFYGPRSGDSQKIEEELIKPKLSDEK